MLSSPVIRFLGIRLPRHLVTLRHRDFSSPKSGYAGGMDDWTPGDISAMLGNPFYAINIDPTLAEPHEPLIPEDLWVEANVRQIEELGAESYLRNLLSILKGNHPLSD